jgi:DNA-binding NarL/FixJ family response regulator
MPSAALARLTPQQRRVAECIGRGLSYAEVGVELSLSEHTVRSYVAAIVLRLGNPEDLEPWVLVFYTVRHAQWEASRAPPQAESA